MSAGFWKDAKWCAIPHKATAAVSGNLHERYRVTAACQTLIRAETYGFVAIKVAIMRRSPK